MPLTFFRFSLFFLFLFLLLSTWRCEYEPTGDYFRDIKMPDTATLQITLDPSDSVYTLYDDALLTFNLHTFGLTIYSTKIFFDNEFIKENSDTTGWVYLDHSDQLLGTHNLTLVVTTSTNTGSLADLLHAEGFVFSQSWEIIYAKVPPPPDTCKITRIVDSAGAVTIFWERYNGEGFKRYEINKAWHSYEGNSFYQLDKVYDVDKTEYTDSTFVGGWVEYSITIVTIGGSANSEYIFHQANYSQLKVNPVGGTRVKLSWEQCTFYKNFRGYEVYDATFNNYPDGKLIFSTKNIETTSCYYDSCTRDWNNYFYIFFVPPQNSWFPYGRNFSIVYIYIDPISKGLKPINSSLSGGTGFKSKKE